MRNPLSRLARRYHNWSAGRRYAVVCRERYFANDTIAADIRDQLARTVDHSDRHRLIADWAAVEMTRSHLYLDGWGAARKNMQHMVHRRASALLYAIAYAEEELARNPHRGRRITDETLTLEFVVGPVLDRAVTAGRIDRALLDELHAAAYPVIGRRAAAVIAYLPVPGTRSDYKMAG